MRSHARSWNVASPAVTCTVMVLQLSPCTTAAVYSPGETWTVNFPPESVTANMTRWSPTVWGLTNQIGAPPAAAPRRSGVGVGWWCGQVNSGAGSLARSTYRFTSVPFAFTRTVRVKSGPPV